MKVEYQCYYSSIGGFGRAARDYLLALHQYTDIDLEISNLDESSELDASPEERYRVLDEYVGEASDDAPDVVIIHAPPADLARLREEIPIGAEELQGAAYVAMTTWEVGHDDRGFFREHVFPHFDAVILPSGFSFAAVSPPSGFVIPHCYDPDFWRGWVPTTPEPYVFYSIGAASDRKNPLGIVRAYLHAFDAGDDVKLILAGGDVELDVEVLVQQLSNLPRPRPPVEVIPPGSLDDVGLKKLHGDSHCYVTATRGEGWGLGAFEAACMGKPVLAPNYGGHLDFLAGYPAFQPIGGMLTPVIPHMRFNRGPGGAPRAIADAPRYLDAKNLWFEPDLVDLAHWMRILYEDRHAGDGRPGSLIEERFTYEVVAPQLEAALRATISRKRESENEPRVEGPF